MLVVQICQIVPGYTVYRYSLSMLTLCRGCGRTPLSCGLRTGLLATIEGQASGAEACISFQADKQACQQKLELLEL